MSQVASPYGMRPVKMKGDRVFSHGSHDYPLTVNLTVGLFFGDPVGLINGNPAAITASPTATLGANSPQGVFMGASWTDPIRGFVNAQYLPANALNNGATNIKVRIADDDDLVFQVQADGPVTVNQIGLNAALKTFNTGSVQTGNSTVALASASIAAGVLAVRIYDFVYSAEPSPGAGSLPGDPFTDVLVIWNPTVHRFQNSGGQ